MIKQPLRALFAALIYPLAIVATPNVLGAEVNMQRIITLTVKKGEEIKLDLSGDAPGTKVVVENGTAKETLEVDKNWVHRKTYTAAETTITIYGNVGRFYCGYNYGNLTALDVSRNTELKELYCFDNQISTLDLSKNTALTGLYCYGNRLTELDVSKNINLIELYCYNNRIKVLDVSKNRLLELFDCSFNQLTALDVSQNGELEEVYCYNNPLTTVAWDLFFCSLPDHTAVSWKSKVYPIEDVASPNKALALAANGSTATSKSWKILYRNSGSPVEGFTGQRKCPPPFLTLTYHAGPNGSLEGETTQRVKPGTSSSQVKAIPMPGHEFTRWSDGKTDNPRIDNEVMSDIDVTAEFQSLASVMEKELAPLPVHPNPTQHGIHMVAEGTVTVCSLGGDTLLTIAAKGEFYLDLGDLPAGVYIVRTGNRIARVVKR